MQAVIFILFKRAWREAEFQEFGERMSSVFFPIDNIYNEAIGVAEFRHHLAAHAAGICGLRYSVFAADYGD